VALAAADTVTLQLDNGSLAGLTVDQGSLQALVSNHGVIQADGGRVLLTAEGADRLSRAVVNHDGVIEARTLANVGGEIRLLGDMESGEVRVNGALDASAPSGGNGGFIETSAADISIGADVAVTTRAASGETGVWLLDPLDFVVAADGDITGATLSAALESSNVIIQSTEGKTDGNGDILVNEGVSWKADTGLTLIAERNVDINSTLLAEGDSAFLDFRPNGDGRFNLGAGASVTLTGSKAGLSIAGAAYTLVRSAEDLQAMTSGGLYAVAHDVDASSTAMWDTGFNPLGNTDLAFGGALEGLGHRISGLNIRPASGAAGLFANLSGEVSNLTLESVSISGSGSAGALAAQSSGLIRNVSVSGLIDVVGNDTASTLADIGGLVGSNTGFIADSASSVVIKVSNPVAYGQISNVGGLVGVNQTGGVISSGQSVGSVNLRLEDGGLAFSVGGLVGLNAGTVDNSAIATKSLLLGGTVDIQALNGRNQASAFLYDIGGLAGRNDADILLNPAGNNYIPGAVTTLNQSVGGYSERIGNVVGNNGGLLQNATAAASLQVTGGNISDIGAIAGVNSGTIQNANASSQVQAITYNANVIQRIGGLVGNNQGDIADAYSTGSVLISSSGHVAEGGSGVSGNAGVYHVGGLVGFNKGAPGTEAQALAFATIGSDATITNSLSGTRVDIQLTDGGTISGVGGLVGSNRGVLDNSTISTAGFTGGTVTVSASNMLTGNAAFIGDIGGVIGNGSGKANVLGTGQFYQAGDVAVTNTAGTGQISNVGGVIGANSSSTPLENVGGALSLTINDSAGVSVFSAGGVAGSNSGVIRFASGSVALSEVEDQFINRASYMGGVAGYNAGTLEDVTATGTVTGSNYVGGVAGYNNTGGIVLNSRSFAMVGTSTGYSGSASAMGGLVGQNLGLVSGSYATGDITGFVGTAPDLFAGGLVGVNETSGIVRNSYAVGSVNGNNASSGGLVGLNAGTVINSYAANNVSGAVVGGLIAQENDGSVVQGSFYDLGQTADDASGYGRLTADMMSSALYTAAGWDVATQGGSTSVWRLYDGQAMPLLRHFLTKLVVTANDDVREYDGGLYSGGNGVVFSAALPDMKHILGVSTYGGTSQGARNAGSYTLSTGGLYSTQSGYDIEFVGGALRIDPRVLTVTGTALDKVYDGTALASVTATLANVVSGDDVQLETLAFFDDKYAGDGKSVNMTHALNGLDQSNYVLEQTEQSGTASITPKEILVVGSQAQDKTYDGLTTADITVGLSTGLIIGDDLVISGVGDFVDKHAGTDKAVLTSYVLSGTDAVNYRIADETLTASIFQKSILADITAVGRTYNGLTDATTVGSLTGVVAGDEISLTTTGAFLDKHAGVNKTVNVGFTLDGVDAGNYDVTANATTTASIDRLSLSPLVITADSRTYDGTTDATTHGALTGVLAGDDVSLTTSGAFQDKHAGVNKTVNVGFSLDGVDAGNYDVTANTTTTATIDRLSLSPLVITADSRTYDGTTDATTHGALTGVLAGDDVNLTTSGSFLDKHAGVNKTVNVGFSLDGVDAANYDVTANTTTLADITRLSISGQIIANNKVYDGTTAATTSGSLTGVLGADDIRFDRITGFFSTKNAGSNKSVSLYYTLAGSDADNYTVVANTTTTATIERLAIIGTLVAADKIYDADTFTTSVRTLSGVLGDDQVTLSARANFDNKNAGTDKTVTFSSIRLSGIDAGNYTVTANTTDTADIFVREITANIVAEDKVYDGTREAATYADLDNLVDWEGTNPDDIYMTTSGQFVDRHAGTAKTVMVSGVLAGADVSNYRLVSVNSEYQADIYARDLSVTGSAVADKVYDGQRNATVNAGMLAGVLGDDEVSIGVADGLFADRHAGTGKEVAVSYQLTGASAGDYYVPEEMLSGNIIPKALTVSGSVAADKVYDGTRQADVTAGQLQGLISGDTVAVDAAGQFNSKHAGTDKPVTVNYSLTGSESGNYTLAGETLLADITPRTLTISGSTAADKVYDAGLAAVINAGVLGNKISGDDVTAVGTGLFADKHAGTDKAVTVSYALAGSDAGNYVLGGETLSADITRAILTIRANDAVRQVGQPEPAFSINISNFLVGDNVSGLSGATFFTADSSVNLANFVSGLEGTLTFETNATPASGAGFYAITPSGLSADNYQIQFLAGRLTVTAASSGGSEADGGGSEPPPGNHPDFYTGAGQGEGGSGGGGFFDANGQLLVQGGGMNMPQGMQRDEEDDNDE